MFSIRNIFIVTFAFATITGLSAMATADPPDVQKLVAPVTDLPVTESSHRLKQLEEDVTDLKTKVTYLETINALIKTETFLSDDSNDFTKNPAFVDFTQDWYDRAADSVRKTISASMKPNYNFMQVNSNGSILGSKGGDVAIDGIEYQSFNNYDFENGQPNKIFISAPGLSSSGNNFTLYGDAKLDVAVLDGCLSWKKQKQLGGLNLWQAKDVQGKLSSVQISEDLPISISRMCDNRYVLRRNIMQVDTLYSQDPSRGIVASMHTVDKLVSPDEGNWEAETEHYVQSYYDVIGDLKSSKSISEDDIDGLIKIVDMMRDKKIPAAVPVWADFYRRPDIFILKKWDIKNAIYSDGSIRIIGESTQGASSIKRYGELIYFKPKYFVEDIQNDCALADMTTARIGRKVDAENDFGGVGISPERDQHNNIRVNIVDAKGGIAQAAVKNGDIIIKINGQPTKKLSDASVVSLLRGKINTKVFLTVLTKGKKLKIFTVTRKRLGQEFISALKMYKNVWPYKYINFMIVDGATEPVTFAQEGSSKNVMTIKESKSKVKFTGLACYNITQTAE